MVLATLLLAMLAFTPASAGCYDDCYAKWNEQLGDMEASPMCQWVCDNGSQW